jgi:hypothetical protein
VPIDSEHRWSVRVVGGSAGENRAFVRNHAIGIGRAASFRESDTLPSAIELAIAALGGDLMSGLYIEAERAGIEIEAAELTLGARLENPLAHLAVVGEGGSPRISGVDGTLYLTAAAAAGAIEKLWGDVLARSPLHQTLLRSLPIQVAVRVLP